MARFSGQGREPVDAVVDRWRTECLIQDDSLLFAGESVWTLAHAEELTERFNEAQLVGEQTFEQKLATQLDGASGGAIRLMAEIVAVYLLFTVSVSGRRKHELVSYVLGLNDDEFPVDSDLHAAFRTGIGGPGQGYNTNRPVLLAYLINFTRRFKGLADSNERTDLLADPWRFRDWLVGEDDEADGGEQMMRQLLLHLLFPDAMERIAASDHKWRIVDTFDGLLTDPWDDGASIDERLYAIRNRLNELLPNGQEGIGGAIDFYYTPLREAWDAGDSGGDDDGEGISNLAALELKKQVVLYGPPGTGKTYEAKDLAKRLIRHQALVKWKAPAFLSHSELIEELAEKQVRRLQLHQGYSYEDFIWGMRLGVGGATIPQEGYLLKLVEEIEAANAQPPGPGLVALPWVLVLDELNRVDLSRLLGECFSLLDDRNASVDLAMLDDSGEVRQLRLPENLYFIGTLNLIDQSVEQLDFALRRRFLWLESGFDADAIPGAVMERWEKQPLSEHNEWWRLEADVDQLVERARALNASIRDSPLLGEQYELGHTYFFDVVGFIAAWGKVQPKGPRPRGYLWSSANHQPRPPVIDLWRHSLRPLLQQYLAGIEPQASRSELSRLRDVFLNAPK